MPRCKLLLALCWLFSFTLPLLAQADFAHPLDPLTPDEIAATVATLKAEKKATDNSRFYTLVLHEPPKAEVLNFRPGAALQRQAFVVVFERATNQTFEALVDVNARHVVAWKEVKNVQPWIVAEDFNMASSITSNDPAWQAALKKRGITDHQNVQVDSWAPGWFGFADEAKIRVARGIAFYRGTGRNSYARPIEGLVAYVDLTNRKMLKIVDTGVVPLAKVGAELDPASNAPLRAAPKPLVITQPEGASFDVRGHEVRWQNWRFRYAMHPREGLVLYTVGYEDQGQVRSVMYRGALSEMVVPYGDPGTNWFIRNAFDEGEYGVGLSMADMDQHDVPTNATFLPARLATEEGAVQTKPRAVAIYERAGGLLWKQADFYTGKNETRRARELVLAMIATIGNYEYCFNWVFHQDGALEMEIMLTGILLVKGVDREREGDHAHVSPHGHLVAPNIEAPHHQHFFNFRLDLDIDGAGANSIVEQNTMMSPPGKNNPQNNAFTMQETIFKRELEAKRQLNFATVRRWKIINAEAKNALGQAPGYLLVTGENSPSFSGTASWVRRRAGFLNHHLWVTPYAPEEMYSAGFYINQNRGGEGLPAWTKANRPIANRDIVLWYTMGVTHIPRPEDWPVMPVHKTGFKLMPNGFFARNPTMNVPPEQEQK